MFAKYEFIKVRNSRKGGGTKMFIVCVWSTVSIGITGETSKKGVDDYYK